MKRVLMLVLAMTVAAVPAFADHIGIYADENAQFCTGPIAVGTSATVYLVHFVNYTGGSTGSEFKVQDNTGLVNTGAVLDPVFLSLGSWDTGISIAYTSCLPPGYHTLITLSYYALTNPGACLGLSIVPDPILPNPVITVVDCAYYEIPATGGRFFFNSDDRCQCLETVPTKTTTWGRVKSLYR